MSSPAISFSVAEFEQAGLLDTTVLHLGDAPGSAASSQTADDDDYMTAILQNTTEPADLLAQAQQLLFRTVNQQSMPRESDMPQASSPRRQVTHLPKLESATDREAYKKQLNREHQRQYRQRQQAKTKALSVQLATTKEELEKSRLHQQELEAKLKDADIGRTTDSDTVPEKENAPSSSADEAPLNISIPGKECQMSSEDLSCMTDEEYRTLWVDYVHELQRCLAISQQSPDKASDSRMHQLVLEALHLRGQHMNATAQGTKVAQPSIHRSAPNSSKLPAFHRHLLAVVRLTNEQVQDLMFLRRVCRLRQQQLAAQREELTAKLEDHSINPFSNTSRRSDLASQLAENLAEHHQVFYRSLWGAYNGVLSMQQTAQILVYCDPDKPILEDLVRHAIQENNIPVDSDGKNLQKADWEQFWQYTETVKPTAPLKSEYVPIACPKPSPATSKPMQLMLY